MSTIVPITITASPLPSNMSYTPQQFMDAMVSRFNVVTAVDSVSIVSQGATPPTSNVGPWLKDGTTWYVWSSASGSYVPVNADPQTLKYVASTTAPDWRVYTLWIQLNGAGTQAIGLAYWDAPNTTWRNVYDSTFVTYNTQIATAVTLYPVRGDGANDVDAVFAGPGPSTIQPVFDLTATFDPSGIFGGSTITVPVGGYFRFDAKGTFECVAGTPTANAIIFGLARNGTPMLNDAYTAPIVNGVTGVRNYSFSTLVEVNPSDQFTLYASITCTAAATWRVKKEGTYLAASRVNASL